MRAWDITLFMIFLQLSIGIVNGLFIFSTQYYPNPQNEYTRYNVTQLEEFQGTGFQILDYFVLAVQWAIEGAFWFGKLIFAVVIVYPTLVSTMGIPALIAGPLQVALYMFDVLGYIQWKSKVSVAIME